MVATSNESSQVDGAQNALDNWFQCQIIENLFAMDEAEIQTFSERFAAQNQNWAVQVLNHAVGRLCFFSHMDDLEWAQKQALSLMKEIAGFMTKAHFGSEIDLNDRDGDDLLF